jgi:hypothetical protein
LIHSHTTVTLGFHHDEPGFQEEARRHSRKHGYKTRAQWRNEILDEEDVIEDDEENEQEEDEENEEEEDEENEEDAEQEAWLDNEAEEARLRSGDAA